MEYYIHNVKVKDIKCRKRKVESWLPYLQNIRIILLSILKGMPRLETWR